MTSGDAFLQRTKPTEAQLRALRTPTPLSREDLALLSQFGNTKDLQRMLQSYMNRGRITQEQAADLWDWSITTAESRIAGESQRQIAAAGAGDEGSQVLLGAWDDYRRQYGEIEFRDWLKTPYGQAVQRRTGISYVTEEETGPQLPKPFEPPEFEGADITGTREEMDWFARTYPNIVSRFKKKPVAQQTQDTWASLLSRQIVKSREDVGVSRARLERPWAFAPRIRTVGL